MATRPHDLTDLYLSPVVLAVDARIEELGHLSKDQLNYEVALESGSPDFTRRGDLYGHITEGSATPVAPTQAAVTRRGVCGPGGAARVLVLPG